MYSKNPPAKNKQLIRVNQLPSNIKKYLLEDYTFLNEYQLLDSPFNSEYEFLAKIKSTQQLVKFIKKPFLPKNNPKGQTIYKRFQALFQLFQKGIVLADNIFILQQANNQLFYYIIEPYLSSQETDSPFVTLQQYLFENRLTLIQFQHKKDLFIKCKNLLDNLSLYQQPYYGLNSKKIIIDDEANLFLLPFQLQTHLVTKPYERSYYPLQILTWLQSQQNKPSLQFTDKWDIWSFGCIAIEIFLYITPYLLSTSLDRQIARIKKQTQNIFKDFRSQYINQKQSEGNLNQRSLKNSQSITKDEQKVLNFLMNSLNLNQNERSLSFEKNLSQTSMRNQRKTSRIKNSVKRLIDKSRLKSNQKVETKSYKYSSLKNSKILTSRLLNIQPQQQEYRQLNLSEKQKSKKHYQQVSKDQDLLYTLEIKIKSLLIQDLKPLQQHNNDKEIKVFVTFSNGETFQFFVDCLFDEKMTLSELSINRKITFYQKQMKSIEELLQQDIEVNLSVSDRQEQNQNTANILINLQALTIRNESGQRMWRKPIKGTYVSQKDSSFCCKLKIEAAILNDVEKQTPKQTISNMKTSKNDYDDKQKTDKLFIHDQLKQSHLTNKSRPIKSEINIEQSRITLQNQQSHQQNEPDSKFTSYPSKKSSSLSKFSSINSQLDEISKYWKKKIEIDQKEQELISVQDQQIPQTQQPKENTNNVLKQLEIQQNLQFNQSIQSKNQNDLSKKVKRMLQQNISKQKITEHVDLSKKLKRLLMK